MSEIDWRKFDGKPEMNCVCRCVFRRLKDGDEIPSFRSHARFIAGLGLRSRKPCPDCGSHDNLHSVGGDYDELVAIVRAIDEDRAATKRTDG